MTDPAATIAAFARDGYAVIAGLVAPDRVAALRDHLMTRATAATLRLGGDEVPGTASMAMLRSLRDHRTRPEPWERWAEGAHGKFLAAPGP